MLLQNINIFVFMQRNQVKIHLVAAMYDISPNNPKYTNWCKDDDAYIGSQLNRNGEVGCRKMSKDFLWT